MLTAQGVVLSKVVFVAVEVTSSAAFVEEKRTGVASPTIAVSSFLAIPACLHRIARDRHVRQCHHLIAGEEMPGCWSGPLWAAFAGSTYSGTDEVSTPYVQSNPSLHRSRCRSKAD